VGKTSFDQQKLVENASSLLSSLLRAKPASAKGTYLLRVAVSSTMGPGVHVDPTAVAHQASA
jgi:large subunit ribosomal protein L1